MSEDRNNGLSDQSVSDIYRESATERAPASLNEAVLHDAAAHASKGYAHSMLWMRPLAWAATVVLSVAIVIQVVMPPGMAPELPAESPASLAAPASDDADVALLDVETGGDEEAAAADEPPKRLRDQEVREENKLDEYALPAVAAESVPEVGEMQERIDAAEASLDEAAVMADATESPEPEAGGFEAAAQQSVAGLQQASEFATLRSVQPGDYAPAVSPEDSVCEPEDLESPAAWSECIERLEEMGRQEEALAERMMLAAAFPDFEWPAD